MASLKSGDRLRYLLSTPQGEELGSISPTSAGAMAAQRLAANSCSPLAVPNPQAGEMCQRSLVWSLETEVNIFVLQDFIIGDDTATLNWVS